MQNLLKKDVITNRIQSNFYTGLLIILLLMVCLNISFAHQALYQMISVDNYYSFKLEAPFAYRVLPMVLYKMIIGNNIIQTHLPSPLQDSAHIFQMALDTISLFATIVFLYLFVRTVTHLKKLSSLALAFSFLMLVLCFGIFFVPNISLFYTYDFLDFVTISLVLLLSVTEFKYNFLAVCLVIFVGVLSKETAFFYASIYIILKSNGNIFSVKNMLYATVFITIFIAAKNLAIYLANLYNGGHEVTGSIIHNQINYHLQQLKNPLFYFVMSGIFSYLYIPVFCIRKSLNKVDYFLLLMVLVWIVIMFFVGTMRELRIFTPMSFVLFAIIVRHIDQFNSSELKSIQNTNLLK